MQSGLVPRAKRSPHAIRQADGNIPCESACNQPFAAIRVFTAVITMSAILHTLRKRRQCGWLKDTPADSGQYYEWT